jgi:hypothetical protein
MEVEQSRCRGPKSCTTALYRTREGSITCNCRDSVLSPGRCSIIYLHANSLFTGKVRPWVVEGLQGANANSSFHRRSCLHFVSHLQLDILARILRTTNPQNFCHAKPPPLTIRNALCSNLTISSAARN